MLDVRIELLDQQARETIGVTTKAYRDTVRRALSVTSSKVGVMTKFLIERGENRPYFSKRKASLIKSYYSLTRLRFNWRGEDAIVAATQPLKKRVTVVMRGKYLSKLSAAVEMGGTYMQWQREHDRRVTSVFGRPVGPTVQKIKGARHPYTEPKPQGYMEQAVARLGPDASDPLVRGLKILLWYKRAPTRADLLPGGGPF